MYWLFLTSENWLLNWLLKFLKTVAATEYKLYICSGVWNVLRFWCIYKQTSLFLGRLWNGRWTDTGSVTAWTGCGFSSENYFYFLRQGCNTGWNGKVTKTKCDCRAFISQNNRRSVCTFYLTYEWKDETACTFPLLRLNMRNHLERLTTLIDASMAEVLE